LFPPWFFFRLSFSLPPHPPYSIDYVVYDVPHSSIRLLDKPYTTDVLKKFSFRHEIGVPDGFYPEAWMRKKLRSRPKVMGEEESGDEFKRKETKESVPRAEA
jgi:hypothetical protein